MDQLYTVFGKQGIFVGCMKLA